MDMYSRAGGIRYGKCRMSFPVAGRYALLYTTKNLLFGMELLCYLRMCCVKKDFIVLKHSACARFYIKCVVSFRGFFVPLHAKYGCFAPICHLMLKIYKIYNN